MSIGIARPWIPRYSERAAERYVRVVTGSKVAEAEKGVVILIRRSVSITGRKEDRILITIQALGNPR